ncbi:hypothetical protein OF83DRAFT_556459 [Amylostereum chailletii]|nr:hypothetical protein OF83DRAFT_556459 [Amylostereum chailletii]
MPSPGKRPAKGYEALVRSLFTSGKSPTTEEEEDVIPPRSPSRMDFLDAPSACPSLPVCKPKTSPAEIKAPIEVDDEDEEDDIMDSSSEDWYEDVVYVETSSARAVARTPSGRTSIPPSPRPAPTPPPSDITSPPPPSRPIRRPPLGPHHGLSRSALQHQKWLWSSRYDEWMQWEMDVEEAASEAHAYGGLAGPVSISPPSRRSPSPEKQQEDRNMKERSQQLDAINPNIFPRTGDLSELHNPHAARLDRYFGNYPLWTIHKVLYVFNMGAPHREEGSGCISPSPSSTGASSCLALIEDGCDSDASSSPTKSCASEDSVDSDRTVSSSYSTSSSKTPEWETSWDGRWEVLQELVRATEGATLRDVKKPALVTTSFGLPVVVRSLGEDSPDEDDLADADLGGVGDRSYTYERPLSRSRFYFSDAEDEPEDDDDDDEDYGEILLNPRFSGPFVAEPVIAPGFVEKEIMKGGGGGGGESESERRRASL